MSSHELPAYSEVSEMLAGRGVVQDPAECHGLLSALLCGSKDPVADWLAELLPEHEAGDMLVAELKETLEGLAAVARLQLQGADFSFELLLPGDEVPLGQRLRALGHWCQGFYLGLGIVGVSDLEQLPDDSREIVQDMTEIALIDELDEEIEGSASEEDETAYTELVEYLRVGVLLIYEELSKPDNVVQH